MRLWLSQDPSGSAGQRATVRSQQSLATDETYRDKGSGWIPEPAENQYYQRLGSVWIIRGDSNLIYHGTFITNETLILFNTFSTPSKKNDDSLGGAYLK